MAKSAGTVLDLIDVVQARDDPMATTPDVRP
jgi:hypothetical protein